ncbi:MAG: ABC transporter permease [Gemmatimonadetes bacterium]|nr:ABC transporter permease [Gemmatimonadota bacterium]
MPYEFTGGGRCCWSTRLTPAGAQLEGSVVMHPVSGSYFDIFEIRFVAGNAWRPGDERARPLPAVINEPLAVAIWGSANAAVGREIATGNSLLMRVAGVIAPYRHYGPDREAGPALLLPITATPFVSPRAHFAVRVDAVDDGLAGRLREAV